MKKNNEKPTSSSASIRLNKVKPVYKAPPSYGSLVAENKKLKEEHVIMEDRILCLTKRNEELTNSNIKLAEALATEQATSKVNNAKFADTLAEMKKSFATSAATECVEVEHVKCLEDWTKVQTKTQYKVWHEKLTTKAKQKEMAKYLEENIDEDETLRDAVIASLKLMFSKNVFLKYITFGFETGRIYFKKSNLLKSMRICLATKFPLEKITVKVIQKKIRNFKDALSKNDAFWVEDAEIVVSDPIANNDNLESSDQNNTGSSADQDLTYCFCKRSEFSQMVLCDNNLCKIKWYHFPCVSLEAKPKGNWYCPDCRGAVVRAKPSKSSVNRNK